MVRLVVASVLAVVVFACSGCSKATVDFREHNDTNVERVRNMYKMYINGNDNRGPKTQEELKEFITTNPRALTLMERVGMNPADFDSYFTGSRDGEPIVVRWGLRGQVDHAIAFEKVGVDGKRFVAFADAHEVGEQEYNDLLDGTTKPETAPDTYDDGPE